MTGFDPSQFHQFQPGQQMAAQNAAPPAPAQQSYYGPPAQQQYAAPPQQGYAPPAPQGYYGPPAQYAPPAPQGGYAPPMQGYAPPPPAPAAPAVQGTLDDFYNQAGGSGKSLTFDNVGDTYVVMVKRDLVNGDVRQRVDPNTQQLVFDNNGNPKFVLVLPLINEHGEDVSWWLSAADKDALVEALTAAAGETLKLPPARTFLRVTYVRDKPNKKPFNPTKVKTVEILRLPEDWRRVLDTHANHTAETTQAERNAAAVEASVHQTADRMPSTPLAGDAVDPTNAQYGHGAPGTGHVSTAGPADEAQASTAFQRLADTAPPWGMQPGPHGGPTAVPPTAEQVAQHAARVAARVPQPAPAQPQSAPVPTPVASAPNGAVPSDADVMAAMEKLLPR